MPATPVAGIIKSLPIEYMFGAPVMAAIKCHREACKAVADFIGDIGLNEDGSVKMVRFSYSEVEHDTDGNATSTIHERVIDLPFIAAVPLPALGVEKVVVDFELEVNTAESSKSSTSASATMKGKLGFGWWSVSMSGSVSHKSEQTRSTDTRSKYSVHLEAGAQAPPEALMRVIDAITAAAVRPLPKDKAPKLPKATAASSSAGP